MKKRNHSLALLLAVCAASLLFSLFYIVALPLKLGPIVKTPPCDLAEIQDDLTPGSLRVIKIAMPVPRAHPLHQLVSYEFAGEVERASGHRFIVETYPLGSLGTEEEAIRGVRRGSVELALAEASAASQISGLGEAVRADGGSLGKRTRRLLEERGYAGLAAVDGIDGEGPYVLLAGTGFLASMDSADREALLNEVRIFAAGARASLRRY